MDRDLSRSLHRLTARLDRAADGFLRAEAGVSYARFLALYMVGSEGADTQRTLAERLGVSEPSVSRMVRVLVQEGWLQRAPDPLGGNRHRLRLTSNGAQLLERWGSELEERLARLLEAAGVPYRTYATHTKRLLATLETPRDERAASARPRPGSRRRT
jgi:DNA-binding MarR family transcriptional regulator